MLFWIRLLILAVIGAIIGWITNVLAIKFIFRPLQPIEIPFLKNIKIQGLIPKRKAEIAKSIGDIVESELISMEEILSKFIEEENESAILLNIKQKVKQIVQQRLPQLIPQAIKSMILNYINDIIDKEGKNTIKELTEKMVHKATCKVKVSEIIEDKINHFELEKLEQLVLAIAKKELKHIEILGGVIGFMIGIIQGIIIYLL